MDALGQLKRFDENYTKQTGSYTAPLIKLVQHDVWKPATDGEKEFKTFRFSLAEDWPWWRVSEYSTVKPEIQSDLRWNEWVSKLQQKSLKKMKIRFSSPQ